MRIPCSGPLCGPGGGVLCILKIIMKKLWKEFIILLIQLFMFYLFPLFAGPTDVMGMVFLILLATLLLSIAMGIVSKSRIKYAYPAAISLLFIPTVWIYYNETALIHAVWYLVISSIGLSLGIIIRKIFA